METPRAQEKRTRRIRIIQLGKFYPPVTGGMESYLFELVTSLVGANKYSLAVIAFSNGNLSVVERLGSWAFLVRAKAIFNFRSLPVSVKYIQFCARIFSTGDVIHVHFPNPIAALALTIFRPRVPIVIHWHSDIVRQKILKYLVFPLQLYCLRRASRILVTSFEYQSASKDLRKFQHKCVELPITISDLKSEFYEYSVRQRAESSKFVVLSIGRLVDYKGFEFLIRSLRYLSADFQIKIVGDGPAYNCLLQEGADFVKSGQLVFLGNLSEQEKAKEIANSDVFCLPSTNRCEAFGVVLLEAMQLSKPLVTTKIKGSGVNWVNQDNETGLIVQPQNPKELADAFEYLRSRPELIEKFGVNARKRYEQVFSHDVAMEKLEEVYNKLVPRVI